MGLKILGIDVGSAATAALTIAGVATGVAWFTTGFTTAAAIGSFAAGTAAAYFARSFVTSFVLGALSQKLAKSPEEVMSIEQDRTVTTKQALAPRQIVYGKTRIGGSIVYLETTESNKYLHIVIAFSGHEINTFETDIVAGNAWIYLNDQKIAYSTTSNAVTGGMYANKVKVYTKTGTDDQTAFTALDSASTIWTSNHRLRGIACAYVRLEFDANVFPNGVPNISFVVEGKKVYDPRTTLTAYSNNPALCLADYLCDTRYGLGADYATEIDETALTTAANICDENVTLAAGGTEKRYTLNGSFDTSVAPETVINNMLSAMGGKLIYTNGKWKIIAAAYNTPTLTFDEDDLRSGIKIQSLVSRRELFNGVKGTFKSVADEYIASDFPPVISDTYIAQDNDEEILKSIELPFTTSPSMAQRLAKIELLKARQQISLVLPLKLIGLKANVGDVINVTNTRMGWSSKPFEVVSSTTVFDNAAIGVDLELRETASSIYDWSTDEESEYDASPNTNLPNPFSVGAPTSLSVSQLESLPDTVLFSWTAPADSFVNNYEAEYKKSSDSTWINAGIVTTTSVQILNVQPGTYDFRVKAVSILNVSSAYESITNQEIVVISPNPVTGLELFNGTTSTVFVDSNAYFAWRRNSKENSFDIGSENFGADSGFDDYWFKDFKITVEGVYENTLYIARTEYQREQTFVYTLTKNIEDCIRQGLPEGAAFREFRINVQQRGKYNQLSASRGLTVSNDTPTISSKTVTAIQNGFIFDYVKPTDPDWNRIKIFASTTSGFTPSESNLVYEGTSTVIKVINLLPKTTYYYKYQLFDNYGGSSYSSQESVLTLAYSYLSSTAENGTDKYFPGTFVGEILESPPSSEYRLSANISINGESTYTSVTSGNPLFVATMIPFKSYAQITGTVSVNSVTGNGSKNFYKLVGSSTAFTTDLQVGDVVIFNNLSNTATTSVYPSDLRARGFTPVYIYKIDDNSNAWGYAYSSNYYSGYFVPPSHAAYVTFYTWTSTQYVNAYRLRGAYGYMCNHPYYASTDAATSGKIKLPPSIAGFKSFKYSASDGTNNGVMSSFVQYNKSLKTFDFANVTGTVASPIQTNFQVTEELDYVNDYPYIFINLEGQMSGRPSPTSLTTIFTNSVSQIEWLYGGTDQ